MGKTVSGTSPVAPETNPLPEGAGITAGTTLNALSVDVEDYFHVEAFADRINPAMWETFPRRVVDNTLRLVELFGRMQARATFFILGWVAEREPSLVRRIQEAGHEVGCHSYAHRRLWQLTPEEFRELSRRETIKWAQVIKFSGAKLD